MFSDQDILLPAIAPFYVSNVSTKHVFYVYFKNWMKISIELPTYYFSILTLKYT